MTSNRQPPVDRCSITVNSRTVCRITRDHRVLIHRKMTKDEAKQALEYAMVGIGTLMQTAEQFIGAFVGDKAPTPGCTCPSCGLILFYRQLQEPHLH